MKRKIGILLLLLAALLTAVYGEDFYTLTMEGLFPGARVNAYLVAVPEENMLKLEPAFADSGLDLGRMTGSELSRAAQTLWALVERDNPAPSAMATAGEDGVARLGLSGELRQGVYLVYAYGMSPTLHFLEDPNTIVVPKGGGDIEITFTYQLRIRKVDDDHIPLPGAMFSLQQDMGGTWVNVGATPTVTENGTLFTFSDLEKGRYRVVEVQSPYGYSPSEPVEVDISWTTSGKGGKEPDDPSDVIEIVNHKMFTLPSTGGVGTGIFYILGAVLVIAAAAALLLRRRSS